MDAFNSADGKKKDGMLAADVDGKKGGALIGYAGLNALGDEDMEGEIPLEEDTFPSPPINMKELEHGCSDDTGPV